MKVIDLFAGCGGLSLGFQQAGFEIVAAFDNWPEACAVYAQNFEHPIYQTDLSQEIDLSIFQAYQPDMIIGGPPCQDFSSAGKRNETLGRADLTLTFTDIVCTVRPSWFVMENVERITKSSILKEALDKFKKTGYGLTLSTLDASYCGVPQSRKRFFMVGCQDKSDNFLAYHLQKNQTQKQLTVHDFIGDKLDIDYYYRHPRSYARRGIFSVHEPSPTIRGVNRPIPKNYKKHEGDLCEPTGRVRPLTTLERSYIQTFPEDFIWSGSKTQQEQMIGNAVPVRLAKYVADCIREYTQSSEYDNALSYVNYSKSKMQLELFE